MVKLFGIQMIVVGFWGTGTEIAIFIDSGCAI
jgi:hypothetical protein